MISVFPHDKSYDYDADHVNGEIFNATDDLSQSIKVGTVAPRGPLEGPALNPSLIIYVGMMTPTSTHPDRL